MFTPYGATECLPVASIGGREVLEKTAERTREGAGTCVGRRFPRVTVRIIAAIDKPIATINDAVELPPGEIGEIIVRSPSATREYFRRPDATAKAKIKDGDSFWHRMGDVGYLDDDGLLWFCGRKTHVVHAADGPLYTIRCEAIFSNHDRIYRSALVGVGEKPNQRPVMICEPQPGEFPQSNSDRKQLRAELLELSRANALTKSIETILFHHSLPVDIRHNVKIFREKLVPWAAQQLSQDKA